MEIFKSRNYIVLQRISDLNNAKKDNLCKHIVFESGNCIYIWNKIKNKWEKEIYSFFGAEKVIDFETTGGKAYQLFYSYCGKDEIERMKKVFSPIPLWESEEQMHYANMNFAEEKIYKDIYEFDANSAFTYGVLQLPSGFEKLKEYMLLLYEEKRLSTDKLIRSKYKNLQNYLIGYFARIKEFVKVRSEIISKSNSNIIRKMMEIKASGGQVYLSNTDSIITESVGAKIMQKYIGDKAGMFKLSNRTDKLYYKSSNCYQIGEKIVYSGVKYFARKHTNFFDDIFANQSGNLVEGYDFVLNENKDGLIKRCRIRFGEIVIDVFNVIGEHIDTIVYKIKED